MKNIAIYSSEPYSGGEVNYIKTLIATLASIPDINMLAIFSQDTSILIEDVPSYKIQIIKSPKCRFPDPSFLMKVRRLFHVARWSRLHPVNYNNQLNLKGLDLVIFPYFTLEALGCPIPYIIIPHDKRAFDYHSRFKGILISRIFRKASAIIAESSQVKDDILRVAPVHPSKIKVFCSPPPIPQNSPSPEEIRQVSEKYNLPRSFLFYPAHIIPLKNHLNLVKAVKRARDISCQDIKIVCTYPSYTNAYFEAVKQEIKRSILDDSVTFLSKVPYSDLISLYRLCTALVVPTLFESVSMPIWEAFFLGVPVVSSNACALPEQVKDAGLLFDPENIDDMAQKIILIWSDGNLRKELIERGYLRIQEVTPALYERNWTQLLNEIFQ